MSYSSDSAIQRCFSFTRASQLIGLLLAVLLLVGAQNSNSGEGHDDHGGFSSDEMIGTLPASKDCESGDCDGQEGWLRAAFFVEGPWQHVLRVAIAATGPGYVTLEHLADGELRAVFHGEVRVDLDPFAFHGDRMRAGILFGAQRGFVAVGLFHGDRMVSKTAHDVTRELTLPVVPLVDSGLLEVPLRVVTSVPLAGRSLVSIQHVAGSLSIAQSGF